MEAEWTVALGMDDPVVVVPWVDSEHEGTCQFVDLRGDPSLVDLIAEAQTNPQLRDALLRLNSADSPFWTAKCDLWTTSDEPRDPYEMDAEPGDTGFCTGSYIDLLARDHDLRGSFARQEDWLKRLTARLRATGSRACRVELVLRHAEVEGQSGFAVSWFVEGCGANAAVAEQRWSDALALSLAVIMESLQTDASGRYNDHTGE